MSLSQHIATQSEHAQRSLVAQVVTDTRGVRADQVDLELLHLVRGDDNILEVSETSVDSVLHSLGGDNIVDNLAARLMRKNSTNLSLPQPWPKPRE